jgi:hypothetical protein
MPVRSAREWASSKYKGPISYISLVRAITNASLRDLTRIPQNMVADL